MNIPKFWHILPKEHTGGRRIVAFSSISEEDAEQRAKELHIRIENAVTKNAPLEKTEYAAPIKEHVMEIVDDQNVITQNYYGALVLNTTSFVVLDIDKPLPRSLWRRVQERNLSLKEQMYRDIKERLGEYVGAYRLYETRNGFRLFLEPVLQPITAKHIHSLGYNVDPLYAFLCEKQQCYRVRLTPKPYRMKGQEPIRIKFLETEEAVIAAWTDSYLSNALRYRTARLLEYQGEFADKHVIELHDQLTQIKKQYILA